MGYIGKRNRKARTIEAANEAKVIATMTKRKVRLLVISGETAEAHLEGEALDKLIHRLALFRDRLKKAK